jgi:penicillin-binding protein 2
MSGIQIKDYLRETRLFNARISFISVFVALLVFVLFIRLAYLQLVNYRYYATLSQANRINPVPIPPVRGLLLDRNGVVLAQNYPVMTLEIIPDQVKDMPALLQEIGRLVTLNEKDLKLFSKLLRERPRFESLTLRTHLTDEEAARFAVNRYRLSGAELRARLQRHYPLGSLGVHALGYVGRINEEEAEYIDKKAYSGTQHIGKLGVEASYENSLLGSVGFEKIETDAHGRAIRTLERIAPVAGLNLHLSLDARMQQMAEQLLGNYKGAVVALDPKTGAILTFASTPTYDPNPFVNGIDTDSYQLLRDNPNKPLVNRALNGKYSPGSTIKAFLGLAALELNQTSPAVCPGWYSLPGDSHRFRCWKKDGHGHVDLHTAVVQSCDVFFYRLAVTLGPDRIKAFLANFGFGAKTGIDLMGESEGLLPSPEWKKARGQPWYPGETVVMGIGQGQILVTPLQLATALGSMANHGIGLQPHLLQATENPKTHNMTTFSPVTGYTLKLLDPLHLETTLKNLTDVVNGEGGTARGIGWNAPYKIAGKTGTAQVKSIGQGESYNEKTTAEHLRDHALFIAFAPVEDPRIVIAVIVENGGHGGSTAAPIARKLMDLYLLGADQAGKPVAIPSVAPGDETD